MRTFIKSITIACAVTFVFSTNAYEISHIVKDGDEFGSCKSNNLVNLQTLEKTVNITKPIISVLDSGRYCINSILKNRLVGEEDLITKDELFALKRRYGKAIHSLGSDVEKVAFMDLFLQKASRERYITNTIAIVKEKLVVAFVIPTASGLNIGDSFHLFPDNRFKGDLFLIYRKLVKENTQPANHIRDLVDYAFHGFEQDKLAGFMLGYD
jgi:hypothetical protein